MHLAVNFVSSNAFGFYKALTSELAEDSNHFAISGMDDDD